MLYNGLKVNTPEYVIELARKQRISMTESEQLMWSKLKNKQIYGYRFRSQHPIHRYIFDFYCHRAMLAIEIDGDIHRNQKEYDNYRDEFVRSMGITVLRFSVEDVLNNIENVINQIANTLLKQHI